MEALQETLQLKRNQADDNYLRDIANTLANYAKNSFSQEQKATTSFDERSKLITNYILQHISSATHNLPGCDGSQEKLGSSLSSFDDPKQFKLSKKEAIVRTRFLQSAELITRTHAASIEETVCLQLRSTIFNNFAMIHRLCDRPHAALRCLVAAAEVEVEANLSDTDQALTHLNLSAVLSSLDRHRDALGHANISIKLLSRRVKAQKSDSKKAASLLTMAHYNAAVEREHMKHRASSLMSYRAALKMAKEQLPKDHPVVTQIASGIFDASTNTVQSYKLPTPPFGSPRSPRRARNSPRSDRLALKHLGLNDDRDKTSVNSPFSKSMHGGGGSPSPMANLKRIKRYGSLEEEVVAKFKDALKSGNRTIHGTRIETIEDIFLAIDEDGSGTVSTAEFKLGLSRLSIMLSDHAIERLMNDIDSDKSGEITYDEFINIMNRKFKKRAEVTAHSSTVSRFVASKDSKHKALMKKKREALRKASPTATQVAESPSANKSENPEDEEKVPEDTSLQSPEDIALHTLFMEFDTDGNGTITMNELSDMLKQLPERSGIQDMEPFSETDTERIMGAFDTDGDGEIEEVEFNNWIKNGLERTKEDRDNFASTSPLAKKLAQLLEAIEVLVKKLLE